MPPVDEESHNTITQVISPNMEIELFQHLEYIASSVICWIKKCWGKTTQLVAYTFREPKGHWYLSEVIRAMP